MLSGFRPGVARRHRPAVRPRNKMINYLEKLTRTPSTLEGLNDRTSLPVIFLYSDPVFVTSCSRYARNEVPVGGSLGGSDPCGDHRTRWSNISKKLKQLYQSRSATMIGQVFRFYRFTPIEMASRLARDMLETSLVGARSVSKRCTLGIKTLHLRYQNVAPSNLPNMAYPDQEAYGLIRPN